MFKPNDTVKCIDADGNVYITKNSLYTVLAVGNGRISVRANDNEIYFYKQSLFKLQEPAGMELFESISYAQSLIGKTIRYNRTNTTVTHVKVYLSAKEFESGYGSMNAQNDLKANGFSVCVHGTNGNEYPIRNIELVPTSTTMKLTDDYDAIIYKDKVEVGCQTITKEVLKELLAKMEEL